MRRSLELLAAYALVFVIAAYPILRLVALARGGGAHAPIVPSLHSSFVWRALSSWFAGTLFAIVVGPVIVASRARAEAALPYVIAAAAAFLAVVALVAP